MDRNSVTGLALIGLIMIVWLQFMTPEKKLVKPITAVKTEKVERQVQAVQAPLPENLGVFASAAGGKEQLLKVDNDVFRATLSTKGASLKSLVLKEHLDSNHKPFNLVSNDKNGALSLLFLTRKEKKLIRGTFISAASLWIPFIPSPARRAMQCAITLM